MNKLLEMASECPGLIIAVTYDDLVSACRSVLNDVIRESRPVSDDNQDIDTNSLVSKAQVKRELGVSNTTLWRWSQLGPESTRGYLPQVKIGNKVFYRSEDIIKLKKN